LDDVIFLSVPILPDAEGSGPMHAPHGFMNTAGEFRSGDCDMPRSWSGDRSQPWVLNLESGSEGDAARGRPLRKNNGVAESVVGMNLLAIDLHLVELSCSVYSAATAPTTLGSHSRSLRSSDVNRVTLIHSPFFRKSHGLSDCPYRHYYSFIGIIKIPIME
jgi:hypothetical protein